MDGTGEVVLVLGGTRSGKSAVAEEIVAPAAGAGATYLATGPLPEDGDPEWAARVAAHRARRDARARGDGRGEGGGGSGGVSWATAEPAPADVPSVLGGLSGAVLVDSLGTWLSAFDEFRAPVDAFVESLRARRARGERTVVVAEEVGMGVHAPTEVGRRFADALGDANRQVARSADRVLLVVAGCTLELGRSAR